MSLLAKDKAQIISTHQLADGDTGSPDVQVAILSARINQLTEHFKNHPHDYHSRRGLVGIINKRRKLLDYLKTKDRPRYQKLIKQLELRY